jgi:hypothetical protein
MQRHLGPQQKPLFGEVVEASIGEEQDIGEISKHSLGNFPGKVEQVDVD